MTLPATVRWPSSSLRLLAGVFAGVLAGVLGACGVDPGGDDPPDEPAHDDSEDGYWHASGKDDPFLCLDPETGRREACPEFRPDNAFVSCDAAGCHGDFEFQPGWTEADRVLTGSDGPSCYSCHNREWSERVQ